MSQLAGVGVMCHLIRPTVRDCAKLALSAEEAGADWCVFPDALGWRDVWLCLAAAAASTSTIKLGPGVTNPYTRHPLVTLEALATFHEISGGRSVLGVAAGGSELSAFAQIDRSDAPDRVRDLVNMVRQAAAGSPPIPLAAPVAPVPIFGGARGRRMLDAVGAVCDLALLWGQTHQELEAAARHINDLGAAVGWSPLRQADGAPVREALVYGILNSSRATRRSLGVDEQLERRIRDRLMTGGMDAAADLVPDDATEAFIIGGEPDAASEAARRLGAECIVVQAFTLDGLAPRVEWARDVLARSHQVRGPLDVD